MPDWICPFCPDEKVVPGSTIYVHVRNTHPKELEAREWDDIRPLLKRPQKPIFDAKEAKKEEPAKAKPQETAKEGTPAAAPDKSMDAWTEQTKKLLGFYPSPATLAITNTFSTPATLSDFINEAIIFYGKSKGVTMAIIKTEGGQSLELMGTDKSKDDSDQDFDRLIKLLTVNATLNQSYSPNTPLIQMIQAVKDSKRGMPMQEFMQQLIMMKELEREPSKQSNMMLPFMFMSKLGGKRK